MISNKNVLAITLARGPENLSSDTASSADALIHAVNAYEEITKKKYDYIIELMCTNPFKSGEMIDDIISTLDRNE